VTGFLRFVGLLNAAVWCGSTIFLTVGLPALFTPELKGLLTAPGVGFAAQAVVGRYFILQYCCAGIALAHLIAEWLYAGRPLWRFNLGLIIALLCIGLVEGLVVQPRMRSLFLTKYYGRTADQQAQAAHAFGLWHGASEMVNLCVMVALVLYLWRVSKEAEHPRFVSFSKIRG
jgi:hypothetical protein